MFKLRRVFTAVIVAVLAVPLSELAAQQPTAWVMPRATQSESDSGPFETLLAHRAELRLSEAQVRSIREAARRLVQANEPLLAQIRDAEVWGVDTDEEAAAIAAVRERFRENSTAAEAEVEEVLTEEQRELARTVLEGGVLAYASPDRDEAADAEAADAPSARGTRPETVPTTVTVENHHYNDVTVYVFNGTLRQRLGRVTGLGTESFNLPPSIESGLTTLRFEVRALARSGSSYSDQVNVRPGDDVRLRIPPSLR